MQWTKFSVVGMLLFFSCSSSDEPGDIVKELQTLATIVEQSAVEIDNVIACASGSTNPNEVIAYVYPRGDATALKYWETPDITTDKNDYAAYTQVDLNSEDFFNGYLKTFTRETEVERWVIISFRESGKLHISNPILLKHQSQNTLFSSTVAIDQSEVGSPLFDWNSLVSPQDNIYFQVVSDGINDLLSGTYSSETYIQYYELDNVVLNITTVTPPSLTSGNEYHFTLMGVSEDNWVNTLVQVPFTAN
jgi:hypothetical protein